MSFGHWGPSSCCLGCVCVCVPNVGADLRSPIAGLPSTQWRTLPTACLLSGQHNFACYLWQGLPARTTTSQGPPHPHSLQKPSGTSLQELQSASRQEPRGPGQTLPLQEGKCCYSFSSSSGHLAFPVCGGQRRARRPPNRRPTWLSTAWVL